MEAAPSQARYSAHIGYLFSELGFEQRFRAARDWGFAGVENPSPYGTPARDVARWLDNEGLHYVQFGLPAGDASKGEKGLAALPDRVDEFYSSVSIGLDYAGAIGCTKVHAMAGVIGPEQSHEAAWAVYLENLAYAADAAGRADITILVEPMSPGAVPHYLLDSPARAAAAIAAIGRPNVRLLLDIFHTAYCGLDVPAAIRQYGPLIGHVHLADFPGRHEPGSGSIDFEAVYQALADIGYDGFLGCEYTPLGQTEAGLGWLARHQRTI